MRSIFGVSVAPRHRFGIARRVGLETIVPGHGESGAITPALQSGLRRDGAILQSSKAAISQQILENPKDVNTQHEKNIVEYTRNTEIQPEKKTLDCGGVGALLASVNVMPPIRNGNATCACATD